MSGGLQINRFLNGLRRKKSSPLLQTLRPVRCTCAFFTVIILAETCQLILVVQMTLSFFIILVDFPFCFDDMHFSNVSLAQFKKSLSDNARQSLSPMKSAKSLSMTTHQTHTAISS